MYNSHPIFDSFTQVDEVGADLSWEFDVVTIFKRQSDGKLFWGADSGCSCTYPYENQTEADLEPLDERKLSQLSKPFEVTVEEFERFLNRVRKLF